MAQVLFLIFTFGSILAGFILFAFSLPIALVLIFAVPIVSFISSMLLYGFGELIDKVSEIERNTRGESTQSSEQETTNSEQKFKSALNTPIDK